MFYGFDPCGLPVSRASSSELRSESPAAYRASRILRDPSSSKVILLHHPYKVEHYLDTLCCTSRPPWDKQRATGISKTWWRVFVVRPVLTWLTTLPLCWVRCTAAVSSLLCASDAAALAAKIRRLRSTGVPQYPFWDKVRQEWGLGSERSKHLRCTPWLRGQAGGLSAKEDSLL